jgi:hypothetical protein
VNESLPDLVTWDTLRSLFAEVDLDAANRWPGVHWAGVGGLCAVMNKLSFGQNHAVNLALLKGFRHSFFNTFCEWLGGALCYSLLPTPVLNSRRKNRRILVTASTERGKI